MNIQQAGERLTDVELQALRREFPAASQWVYANIASRGVVPLSSRSAAVTVIDGQVDGGAEKADWIDYLTNCRSGLRQLINADSDDEIAVTRNVSDGLNIVINAVPMKPGDNVVLCSELEHPNMVFALANLTARGIEVREAAAIHGVIDAGNIGALIDNRTKLVAVSSVTFTPGSRTDCAAIGALCRDRGAFFLVDAVQSLGVLRTDVAKESIDGLATSTSKGLMGGGGLGFLYVREEWARRMNPAYLARFSVDDAGGHESERSGAYTLKKASLRFETGNYNWVGLAATSASLDILHKVGADRVEQHALSIAGHLRAGLERRGMEVYRTGNSAGESHIVTVGQLGGGDTYTTSDHQLDIFAKRLGEAKVKFSIRRGQVRFGFHLYNNLSDVETILACAG